MAEPGHVKLYDKDKQLIEELHNIAVCVVYLSDKRICQMVIDDSRKYQTIDNVIRYEHVNFVNGGVHLIVYVEV